jgi:uncharacterized protein YjaG (DUF416 family)
MTDWKYNVYLADLFEEFENDDEADIKKVVQCTCDRLVMLQNKIKEREKDPNEFLKGLGGLNFIIDDLEFFDYDMDYEEQVEKFDEIMNDLYDFADYNFIWINTFDEKSDGIGKP